MAALKALTLVEFLDSLLSMFSAFVLGTMIGVERQYRQRSGGLRTNVLVAVGAATFVDLGMRLNGVAGGVHVVAYVVSGIGFLGAGVIMKEGKNVWGLNTAATLWCSAAVGACAGADQLVEAIVLTMFVLAGNTLLRPLVNALNRAPIDERAMEATYEMRVTTDADHRDTVRDLMETQLEAVQLPVRGIAVLSRPPNSVELVATLMVHAADPGELDRAALRLRETPFVSHASWMVAGPD